MLTLIVGGLIVLLGAGSILLSKKKEGDSDENSAPAPDVATTKSWEMPVLDGTAETSATSEVNADKFPGWSQEQIQNYLDSGWSEEQLSEWYKQQVDNNSAQD